jgi:hypothetical protein
MLVTVSPPGSMGNYSSAEDKGKRLGDLGATGKRAFRARLGRQMPSQCSAIVGECRRYEAETQEPG